MASFRVAAALLAVAASPSSHGFTPPRVPGPAATHSPTLRYATETFQRSLLEAQFANGAVAPPPVAGAISVDAEHDAAVSPSTPATDNAATLNAILRVAAATDRGQYATPSQKDQVSRHVDTLESSAPTRDSDKDGADAATIPSHLSGTWELLYSNTQLFRSSPFFLAGRATCKTPEQAEQYDWFCAMHRAALAISSIGVVRQVVTSDGRLINEFEVKVGAIPFLSDFVSLLRYSGGLPLTIDGAIVSSADATPVDSASTTATEWELFMDTVEIKGSNVPILRKFLDSDAVALKSRDLSEVLEDRVDAYEVPRPVLRTTYVDDHTRIVRDQDDNVFVYGKVSESEECTDYSGVLPDLGVVSLLEGFNDAVAKVYL